MGKTLIAYYTYSPDGTTQKAAEAIKEITGGDLFKVEPVDKYPEDRDKCIAQARAEIEASFKPEIKELASDLGSYDTVFVGSPNWCSTIAPPIATFISAQDFSGKTVIPFLTFGGSGVGKSEEDVKALAIGASVVAPIGIKASDIGNAKAIIEGILSSENS